MAKNRAVKNNKKIYFLILRYLILVLAALGNLAIFYFIFSPLTIYPVFCLLKLLYNASLSGSTIIFSGFSIQIVEACIAGSAYYLLLILNLTTPMPFKKRIISIIFSFLIFLIINIIRIFFFSILILKSFPLFNLTHLLFWYFLSGVIVFLVWLAVIKIFRINSIPVYSDILYLYKFINSRN
jgi:exosortase/archaeosortase family protein